MIAGGVGDVSEASSVRASSELTHNRNTTTPKYESAVVRSTQNCVHITIKLSIYTRKRYFYISHFSAASRSLELREESST
jgi:hypothetical protein